MLRLHYNILANFASSHAISPNCNLLGIAFHLKENL